MPVVDGADSVGAVVATLGRAATAITTISVVGLRRARRVVDAPRHTRGLHHLAVEKASFEDLLKAGALRASVGDRPEHETLSDVAPDPTPPHARLHPHELRHTC